MHVNTHADIHTYVYALHLHVCDVCMQMDMFLNHSRKSYRCDPPLDLNTMWIPNEREHALTKIYTNIRIRKLTVRQYYYPNYRFHSEFTKYHDNVFMAQNIMAHVLHSVVISPILLYSKTAPWSLPWQTF